MKGSQHDKCRLCQREAENIDYRISSCPNLANKEYLRVIIISYKLKLLLNPGLAVVPFNKTVQIFRQFVIIISKVGWLLKFFLPYNSGGRCRSRHLSVPYYSSLYR